MALACTLQLNRVARYDDFEAKKDQLFRVGNYDKAALVIRAEYHGPSAASGRPKPLLELPGRFYNSTSAWDLYYQPDVRRVGYTGRGFQRMEVDVRWHLQIRICICYFFVFMFYTGA